MTGSGILRLYASPAAWVLAWTALVPPFAAQVPPKIVIAAGTVFDGRGAVLHNTHVVVQGSKIVAIDASASPVDIDLGTRTLMPGWIDTHVHLSWHLDARGHSVNGGESAEASARGTAANAEVTLRAGFTTVQSLGAPVDGAVRDAIAKGDIPGPRVLTSLRQLANGSPDVLRDLVRRVKNDGGDVIKIFATPGFGGDPREAMTDAQLEAACGEAKALGLRTVVHAVYDEGARRAVSAGCTSIEHGIFVSDATLTMMKERGTWFDPNLLVWHNYIDHSAAFDMSDEQVATLRGAIGPTADALRRARRLGVRIVFGTDAVAGAQGRNAEEFVYRVREAGEKPRDALMSASSLAAESLGLGATIGTLAPGFDADLVATDGNPLDDITAVRRVVFVMKSGRIVRRP